MRILSTGIIAIVVLCGLVLAQDATPPPAGGASQQQNPATAPTTQSASVPASETPATSNPRIAPGSVIPVQLTKGIDAKKAKTGDEVEAKVTQDLKTDNGDIVVPKDTKVIGRVTEAQARGKDQKESQLGITFDHAVLKNGSDVPLPMSIQAVIAPPNANANNSNAGSEGAAPPASSGSSGAPAGNTGNSGRAGSMSGATPTPSPSAPMGASESSTSSQTASGAREPITGKTQGVVGISNLKLSTADSAAQGSVLSSEKNNVKLESGTLLLLKVNP
jgi:hypothetical protein